MNWQWIATSLMMGAADYAAACARQLLRPVQTLADRAVAQSFGRLRIDHGLVLETIEV
jgi:hypothetical protein